MYENNAWKEVENQSEERRERGGYEWNNENERGRVYEINRNMSLGLRENRGWREKWKLGLELIKKGEE